MLKLPLYALPGPTAGPRTAAQSWPDESLRPLVSQRLHLDLGSPLPGVRNCRELGPSREEQAGPR